MSSVLRSQGLIKDDELKLNEVFTDLLFCLAIITVLLSSRNIAVTNRLQKPCICFQYTESMVLTR